MAALALLHSGDWRPIHDVRVVVVVVVVVIVVVAVVVAHCVREWWSHS